MESVGSPSLTRVPVRSSCAPLTCLGSCSCTRSARASLLIVSGQGRWYTVLREPVVSVLNTLSAFLTLRDTLKVAGRVLGRGFATSSVPGAATGMVH